MKQPVTKRRAHVKLFETERQAQKWARAFDYARSFNRLPLLDVEQIDDGQWAVVNPDVSAVPHGPRTPVR